MQWELLSVANREPMKLESISLNSVFYVTEYTIGKSYLFIIIIGIQPLDQSGQRPELSQATGMALVRCILGKFLG
jgi:hypothetical protein